MLSTRQRHALLLAVVVGGAVLRFGAVGHGLPRHDLGQDEMITATRVREGVLVGHPGWPRFHWPNLNIHVSAAVVWTARVVEEAAGLATHDDVLIGRAYSAALGTLTLVVLYFAAARLFDPLVGVVAAGFLAVTPLHAFRSRLWVPDVPMTFFYALALLAAVWILARPAYGRFLAAGAAIGLATATKYNGVGACLAVAVAAVLALPRLEDRGRLAAMSCRLALAGAISVAVFFAADLFALPHFDEMLSGMGFISGAYIDVPASGLLGWRIWVYIARAYFGAGYEGVGQAICLLALGGWLVLVARRGSAALLAWLPGLLYLLAFSSILHDPYERMFLPVTLHIAILAAVGLVAAARWVATWAGGSRPASPIAAGVVAAGLLIAAVPVAGHVLAARNGDTRVRAADWLDAHVPAGAFVFREWDMVWPKARQFAFNKRPHDLWARRWTPELVARYMDYVVITSANYERVRRQRYRPDFARRAGYYDELLDGPMFGLAARFAPDLRSFGPEVRIYRSLLPRGQVLGPGKSEIDLLRRKPWVSAPYLERWRRAEGGFRFHVRDDLIGGKVTTRPAGWYQLVVRADSPAAAPVEIGLGGTFRSFVIDGDTTVVVHGLLRPGKNWWRVGAGAGFTDQDSLTVREVRLSRSRFTAGEAASS